MFRPVRRSLHVAIARASYAVLDSRNHKKPTAATTCKTVYRFGPVSLNMGLLNRYVLQLPCTVKCATVVDINRSVESTPLLVNALVGGVRLSAHCAA